MSVIEVVRTAEADPDVPLPAYATAGAAGADIRANLPDRGTVELAPGARALVQTGMTVAVPAGYELQVRSRSGLALKHGVACLNSPGTVDSDYRGELGVILVNLGQSPFVVEHGARIAQGVIAPVARAEWSLAESLDATTRGENGFGSTGQA